MKAFIISRFTHGGIEYKKGETADISEGHFADWQALGLVKAAPEKEPKAKASE